MNSDKHLGNFISSDIQNRNVISKVCDLYQISNSIISDFSSCNSVSLDSLHNTFCMHMYGCELLNLSNGQDEKFTDISALIEKTNDQFYSQPVESQ